MSKKRNINGVEIVDRISELPDDLITSIISCLTLKQAASTSLISTRWKDLWKLYYGHFDFDGSPIVQAMQNRYQQPDNKPTARALQLRRYKFVEWVNHVLQSHQGGTMEQLRIVFDLQKRSYQKIDEWFQLALVKNVHSIELDLTSFISPNNPSTCYEFPIRSRSHCGLKTLVLKHVDISGHALQTLVDNCPNLEELDIAFSMPLKVLHLSSPTLKHLTLTPRLGFGPMDIKISAPNLLFFSWIGVKKSKLVFEDVPKLQCMTLQGYWYHIQSHHSQFDELVLSAYVLFLDGCENMGNTNIPELSRLKFLTITHNAIEDNTFRLLTAYLKAAPLLENLTLSLCHTMGVNVLSEAVWNETNNDTYKNLKRVRFIGFWATHEVKFMKYLENRAPLLKTINYCPCFPTVHIVAGSYSG